MTPRKIVVKIPRVVFSFLTVLVIFAAAGLVIAYGRGYRVDMKQSGLTSTGLISATSDPVGAQVYVNGQLRTATNNSFNIDPGFYTVKVAKEGYISWQKDLRVQGEVVSRADAYLFPSNPSLSPLTNIGIKQPTLSPDGTRIVYIIPEIHADGSTEPKAGLWSYQLSDGPLGRNRDPIQLDTPSGVSLTDLTMLWSPDATHLLAYTAGGSSKLYEVGNPNNTEDVTTTQETILAEWADERALRQKQKLAAFKRPIIDFATSSAQIIAFSPDETKILYEATAAATIAQVIRPALLGTNPTKEERTVVPGNLYVYDSKEDKNYFLLEKKDLAAPTPTAKAAAVKKLPTPTPQQDSTNSELTTPILWFPTSRHLLLPLPGKIDILEYDRTNWTTLYAGPLIDGFVAPWSNGSRIIIMTNLNPNASELPNLYTVNLR